LKDIFLGAFDIDFEHNRLRIADNSVEPFLADPSDILVIGSRNTVHGVEAASKRYFTLLGSQSTLIDLYKRIEAIDRDVSFEAPHGIGVWLKRPRFCSADAGSEHRVSAYICPNIQKQIAFPEKMKRKHHVRKLMQANVDVLCCPSHTMLDCEPLPSNPAEKNLVLKPAP
jgi:hypothetical protein